MKRGASITKKGIKREKIMKKITDDIKRMFRKMDPIFWIFIAILIVERLMSVGSIVDWLYTKLLLIPGIVIGLSLHEAGHAYASHFFGDPTPKSQGRLSINPAAHIDPLGLVFIFVAGFGWGKPVEINPYFYKHKRRDEFIVSIAGVTINLLIAIVFGITARLLVTNGIRNGVLFDVIIYIVYINLVLMIFNLIPCPPLDGWGIVTQIFDLGKYSWWYPVYQRGTLILMALIIFNITSRIITPAVSVLFYLIIGSI